MSESMKIVLLPIPCLSIDPIEAYRAVQRINFKLEFRIFNRDALESL